MNKRGSLLVFAIWVLVVFSILSVGVYKIVSSQITVAKVLEERLVSLYLAKAAFAYAKIERASDDTEYNTLYELGQVRQKQLGKGKYTYTIIDEESKININKAPGEILANLAGLDEELAAAIVDSPLRPFELKEEVLLVEGITPDIYNQFKDIVTVYGDGAVNINTAGEDVFRVLGFDDDLIESVKAYRCGPDFEEGTEDDVAFETIEATEVASFLAEQTLLISLKSKELLGTSSDNFSLKINTEILDRPVMSYNIIMEDGKIKRWMEY
ncbi:MAG: general secretion pathway protein GspK [Candidatus Omnitrophota bacterium]|nr:MAG: general secretion pathway protein GspK [Candidatus Omnitrophota bacterium]